MLCLIRCKEPYDAQISPSTTNNLVVEGIINATGRTTIALSRTLPLKDPAKIKVETNAQVSVIAEDNSVYDIKETGNGTYTSGLLFLNTNQKYRLHIKTNNGGEYLSDYVAVKQTPPIDSVSFTLENDGVHISVSTHDPKNTSRYYKWDYEETWEIHSAYANYLKYANGSIGTRTATEVTKLYSCWTTQNSTSIVLGSSAKLANDVINLAPIVFIPNESEKTSVRYSILINQYSLDRKSYDFYQMLKSNTESLGSVFDPLPSEVTGNINCVSNPLEKVIGYIGASAVAQKRFFINSNQVNSKFALPCATTYVTNKPDSFKLYFGSLGLLPYQADPPFGPPLGYFSSSPYCIDCTLRGSSVKPSFW